MKQRDRVIIEDVELDPRFEPYRAIAAATGFRAVQSTPLLHRDGSPLGLLSTHFRQPHCPSERELRLTDLYFHLAMQLLERKQAEQALHQSEDKLHAFVTATSDIVYEMSPDWRKMFSLRGKEFIATTENPRDDWTDAYIPADEKMRVWAAIEQAIATKSIFELEHRVIRLDGTDGWTFSRAIPLLDEASKIVKWFGTATDITERKWAEEVLAADLKYTSLLQVLSTRLVSEDNIQVFYEEILDAAIALTGAAAGTVQLLDPQTEELTLLASRGFESEMTEHFARVSAASNTSCGMALATGERVFVDFDAPGLDDPDGSLKMHVEAGYVSAQSTPLITRTGQPIGMFSTHWRQQHRPTEHVLRFLDLLARQAADLIEQRQLVDRFHESDLRLSSIIDSAMDAVVTVDEKQRIVLFNPAAEKMFQCPASEALGQPLDRFIPARYRDAHRHHHSEFSRSGINQRSMNGFSPVFGLRPQNEEFPIEGSISQVRVDGQKLFTAILRDVTQRKHDESRLQEQAAMLNQAKEAIMVRDLNDGVHFWNQGAERLYGWLAEEVIHQPISKLLYHGMTAQVEQALKAAVAQGEWKGELRQFAKDGREVTVESHWTLIRDEQGSPKSILVINSDITEKKRLEAQFLRAQRLESIGTLASGIAHDLNNILSPILMGTQMLQTKLKDEQSLRFIHLMQSNAQRGAEMVKQVLSFSRGIGGQKVNLQPKHLIREILRIVEETFPKSIQIEMRLAEDLNAVKGDATQLHQVLLNLCVNARDAMPNGGKLIIEAENRTLDRLYAKMLNGTEPGRFVVITITDTGAGIPKENLDRIFDPFFTTKEPGKGTGLGLATAQGIVTAHGGFIIVESKLGVGTKFCIYLPADQTAREKLEEAGSTMPLGAGELILLIDDEAAVREMTGAALEAFGYKTMTADNGATALSLYFDHRAEIKAVITDLMMPVMDGIATIRALRRLNPNLCIIATSGQFDPARREELRTFRIDEVLEKPYDAEALLNMVAKALGKQAPPTTKIS